MARPTHIIGVAVLSGALLAAVIAVPANAATAPTSQDVDGVTVSGIPALSAPSTTKADVLTYIADNATQSTIDSETGELVAVAPVSKISTRISERNTCKSGDAYWASAATPYTNNCFYGSAGTYLFPKQGTKSYRFYTGKYTARGAWLSSGQTIWGPRQAPGSNNTLTAVADVKGAQVF